jgi:hypothetical protein
MRAFVLRFAAAAIWQFGRRLVDFAEGPIDDAVEALDVLADRFEASA